MSDFEPLIKQLTQAGIKGEHDKLMLLVQHFNDAPACLKLITAYLKRWYAGRLNGLETMPGLLDTSTDTEAMGIILTAFENKLKGTSDITLLYLLSLSERPVPQQHMKDVFRSTLMERWLTRRDDYVRFLRPLGRINEEHWYWVIENLRRLQLIEEPLSGQHDLLYVTKPVRQYFNNKLRENYSQSIFEQATVDMEKIFQDTVVEFKQRYWATPAMKTWISPELQEQLQLNAKIEQDKPKPLAVFWKHEELDLAQQQLAALRGSLGSLKAKTERLQEQLGKNKLSLVKNTHKLKQATASQASA